MMLRAFSISVVLHLIALVSGVASLLEPPSGRGAISASIQEQKVARAPISEPTTNAQRSSQHVVSRNSSADRQPRRSADFSKIEPFLAPTVALAKPAHDQVRKALGEEAPGTVLPAGDGEREYRLNLAREARRYRYFPQGPDGSRIEGVVVVLVVFATLENGPEIRLQRSSGSDALDKAAMGLMAQAAQTASLPLGLQGRRFQIAVPVEYRLTD